MAQNHEPLRLVQEAGRSEQGLYDAGWVATCQCGLDLSPNGGRATRAETEAAMAVHLRRHGVNVDGPLTFAEVRPVVAGQQRLFNTSVAVVANLYATSERDAIARLRRALESAGFDIYDDPGAQDAFEAEEGTAESALPGPRPASSLYG